jgi:hypothetical protein
MKRIEIKEFSAETMRNVSKINEDIVLIIHGEYDNILKIFIGFECINDLFGLFLGEYVYKNISFKPLLHITTLRQFIFNNGLENNSQYEFINDQNLLQKLRLKKIDLSYINKNISLTDLYVHRTIKNENLLSEKFPDLIKFTLHGDTKRIDFDFIRKLENIEEISINYNSHLTSFPKMENPEKIKSITLLNCYSFIDIESILVYKNLERFCLTSYDKTLQLNIDDFIKIKQLKNLKIVFTQWGKKEPEKIKELYKETGWINKYKKIE